MCAVVSAYQMMTDPGPEPQCWDKDQNILDQVHMYTAYCAVSVSKYMCIGDELPNPYYKHFWQCFSVM